MSDFSQTVPELVSWARKNDFAISLPAERLAIHIAYYIGLLQARASYLKQAVIQVLLGVLSSG